jgi:hypothetical protein
LQREDSTGEHVGEISSNSPHFGARLDQSYVFEKWVLSKNCPVPAFCRGEAVIVRNNVFEHKLRYHAGWSVCSNIEVFGVAYCGHSIFTHVVQCCINSVAELSMEIHSTSLNTPRGISHEWVLTW